MKFTYNVKHNGQFYPAGTEVPVGYTGIEVVPKKDEPVIEKAEKPVKKTTGAKKK